MNYPLYTKKTGQIHKHRDHCFNTQLNTHCELIFQRDSIIVGRHRAWQLMFLLLSAMSTGSMGGMAGLLSLMSTTWTLMVVVPLSAGRPLSAACSTNLQHEESKQMIAPKWVMS